MDKNTNANFDEHLKEMLKAYGEAAPRRKPEAEKQTRDRFMMELDTLHLGAIPNPSHSGSRSIISVSAAGIKQLKENLAMSFAKRSSLAIATMVLVLVVFLFGGGGITAYAASSTLPGDALYPVKTSIENARAELAGDPEARARLYLSFAGTRLDEIKMLISEGNYSNLSETVQQFEDNIHKAQDAIEDLSGFDAARAAELRSEAAEALEQYSASLNNLMTGVPSNIQPVIEGAINSSQSEIENSNDDNSNVNINDDDSNANINDDDSNANIIDDSINGNDNNDDSSINANTNDDENNSNVNSNTNSNTNDNNSNLNTNDKSGSGSGGGGGGSDG